MNGEWMEVEIAWAGPAGQRLVSLRVPVGARVADALAAAPIHALPVGGHGRDWTGHVGVFGERCRLDRVLAPGDRAEIYRPLLLDAKAARRERAREVRLRSEPPG